MTLEQLKASAYDALVRLEVAQKELNMINQQIANYKQPEVLDAEEATKTEVEN